MNKQPSAHMPKMVPPSRIGYGGWQASGWSASDPTNFKNLLNLALDYGINFIDTAPVYGDGLSEKLIGEVLKGRDRDKIIIASKFWHDKSDRKGITTSIEQSLSRLGTDYIDIYMQHWPSASTSQNETLDCLQELKDQERVRFIGVSNWLLPEWGQCSSPKKIDYAQLCYNLLWRNIEMGTSQTLKDNNIGLLAYSPLCQGLLAHSSMPKNIPADYRKKNIFYKGDYKNTAGRVLKQIGQLAQKYEASCAQISLAWLLSKPIVSSVIVGVTTHEQLKDNIAALDLEIAAEDIEKLDLLSLPIAKCLKTNDTLWNWHPLK